MASLRIFWNTTVEISLHPARFFADLAQKDVLAGDVAREFLVYGAAIPALAGFIGNALVGQAGVLAPVIPTAVWALLLYAFELVYIWVAAKALEYISSNYDVLPDFNRSFAAMAYCAAPSFLAGAFQLVPLLRVFTILGLYSVYLLYTYLPVVLRVPEDRRRRFGVAGVLTAMVTWVILSFFFSLITGF